MRANPLCCNYAPGETRTPNLLIRSQSLTPRLTGPARRNEQEAAKESPKGAKESRNKSHNKTKKSGRLKRDQKVRDAYKETSGNCCEVCGWRAKPALKDVAGGARIDRLLPAHHIHPVACGGPDTEDNLVQLCLNCHGIAHLMGRMVPAGSDALQGAHSLREWDSALSEAAGGPKVWTGPRTRKAFFFAMTMLSNRAEYVRFAAVGYQRDAYLRILEEEAQAQDAIEMVRINRAFTVSGRARKVYAPRTA